MVRRDIEDPTLADGAVDRPVITWNCPAPAKADGRGLVSLHPKSRSGESFYWAGDSVALATGVHGLNLVVQGRLRRKIVQVHAEHRLRMRRVQSDRIFGRLVQVFWVRTIVDNAVVYGQAARIVYRPSDNRQIATHQRDFWPLADLYLLGSWSDWTLLS